MLKNEHRLMNRILAGPGFELEIFKWKSSVSSHCPNLTPNQENYFSKEMECLRRALAAPPFHALECATAFLKDAYG